MEIPFSIKKSIRENKKIEMDGLVFYPILMREIDELEDARVAVEFMQQNFPVKYATQPLLSAFFAFDYDCYKQSGTALGLFYRALLFLCLALRLGQGQNAKDKVKMFKVAVDPENPAKLLFIQFLYKGEEQIRISPAQFTRWRPILAAQNGLTLPDETADKDLLEAKRDLAEIGKIELNQDFDDLLSAMAIATGKDESELLDWPVRKFLIAEKSVTRIINHVICGIGSMSGSAKWANGNPCPSWCYDRISKNNGVISMSKFIGDLGGTATEKTQL